MKSYKKLLLAGLGFIPLLLSSWGSTSDKEINFIVLNSDGDFFNDAIGTYVVTKTIGPQNHSKKLVNVEAITEKL
ncbi:hypothetical protein [Chryseobacterium oryctis]|uniref:Uncharacterized protein n=1 Tax=Chryseobacterium oryctis TaxID=2952618 RepID=A0ABT3HPH2_9FLAO|nr:hypothetical protein [Chryseobacterium oryctis]MCW3161644.1 hypothetical protein [Chryseobacterium oryctis]